MESATERVRKTFTRDQLWPHINVWSWKSWRLIDLIDRDRIGVDASRRVTHSLDARYQECKHLARADTMGVADRGNDKILVSGWSLV